MLVAGESAQFSVTVLDGDGRPMALPAWTRPVWKSADPATVGMSPDGVASAKEYAETEVTVSLAGLRAWTTVRVNPAGIKLTAPSRYLTQGVQNSTGTAPLIAGRETLLRVFVTGDRPSYYQPRVNADFYLDDRLVHGVVMEPGSRILPTKVDESRLDASFNAVVPAEVIVPGAQMVIELDRDGAIPALPGSRLRLPHYGRDPLRVIEVPPFKLTVVPIRLASDPDRESDRWVEGLTADSDKLRLARSLLPVSELSVEVHEGFSSSADLSTGAGWGELLGELIFLRIAEKGRSYYYGVINPGDDVIWTGLAQIGYPASVGRPDPTTLVHELGHNLGLRHAPCGAGSVDSSYPYEDGAIGVWGYDFHGGRVVSASLYKDMMGYCNPYWISDYHFVRSMNFRLRREADVLGRGLAGGGGFGDGEFRGLATAGGRGGAAAGVAAGGAAETLLLWGRVGDGDLALDPAFVVDAPPTLPAEAGAYRLDGVGDGGRLLFSLGFDPVPLEHGGGVFVFTVPYRAEWAGSLERVVLSGPEGSSAIERFGSRPAAMVTDRATGRVRAVLRDWDGALPAGLAGAATRVAVSEGLPRR